MLPLITPLLLVQPSETAAFTSEAALGFSPPAPSPLRPFNHGPGTSGGGSTTASGETLRKGRWSFEFRSDWTEFEHVSLADAEASAIANDEFDAIERTWVSQLAVSYGLTDDVQLGMLLGYYAGSNFVESEADGMGGAESATADPAGLTDTWATVKWRVMHGASGHLALIGGLKLPTGKDDEKLSNGEELEPSSQPGSGSIDYQAGVAYSRFLTSRITLDANGIYTFRTAHDGFEVGDRADLGVAINYRLTEDVRQPDNWSVFSELNAVWLGKDEEDGVSNDNSGGETLYLSLGVRNRIDEHFAMSLAPAVPILQDTNGDQVETDWRIGVSLTYTP